MRLKHFVGIDVSKNTLDFYVRNEQNQGQCFNCENSKKGINGIIKQLRKIPGFKVSETVFCMEHTGVYNNPLLESLYSIKANIWLESAIRIKQSQGMWRGKNDKIDAQRIADYAFIHKQQMKPWEPQRDAVLKLKNLITMRDRLVNGIKQFKQPLKEHVDFQAAAITKLEQKAFKGTVAAMEKDLKAVEKMIKELIDKDNNLKELFNLITTVDGVGPVIAANIIVVTNEFKLISEPQKFACYSGVAPFEHKSGTSIRGRTRVSHLANKKIKTLLHMAALAAVHMNGELQEYYKRKVDEGKNKMSVINAIRNKIIKRIFAVVNRRTPFLKNYQLTLA
jgi:transposase